jgi:hypothetical protein
VIMAIEHPVIGGVVKPLDIVAIEPVHKREYASMTPTVVVVFAVGKRPQLLRRTGKVT